jgi:hypothetical protein
MRTRTVAFALSLCAAHAGAQSIVGQVSGTVEDASGATVPGVTVTVTHEATGLARVAATDSRGSYQFTHLPLGRYTVAAELPGFKKVVKSGYQLEADGRITVNFTLEIGQQSEVVEVESKVGETVNTVSGEIARVIDRQQLEDVPLNARNYMELMTLIPGSPLLTDDPIDSMIGLGVGPAISGNRGNSNLLTVDGGFNLDSGSNGTQISNVGVDFIQEVSVKASNFSAEYGRMAGASINVVTRSGGNRFGGSAWEYHRNETLDENDYFLEKAGLDKAPYRFNNFGWQANGPVKRDKVFFFAGQEWKKVRRRDDVLRRTLPTRAERAGDFSARANLFLRDPLSGLPCSPTDQGGCFPGNVIPSNRITPDGRAIARLFDRMEQLARTYEDRPIGNNALFQGPSPFDQRQDILRLDYHLSERHRLYARAIHDSYDLVTVSSTNLPVSLNNRLRPGRNYQVGHYWQLRPALIHETKLTAAWHSQRVLPRGEDWKRETYGFTFPQLFTGGGRFENSVPTVAFSGTGAPRGWDSVAGSLIAPTTDISVSDGLTYHSGRHTVKTGLMFVRNRKDQNGRPPYAGDISFNPSGNPNSTGNAFADALLGNFRTYTEAEDDPIGFFRFSQLEAYVTDAWRVGRSLSIEVGARYLYFLPTYTQANNISNFDPNAYDPARAITIDPRTGSPVPGTGDPFNGIVRAGQGVPAAELIRVPRGDDPDVLSVPAGAPRGLFPSRQKIMPRFSFAWAPGGGDKLAIRGGIGVFYDRAQGNIIFSQLNLPPFTRSARFENGNLAQPAAGRVGGAAVLGNINAIDPDLELPRTTSWSLSAQRELPWGLFAEVAYVGNAGRNLLRQPDINAIPFDLLRANRALPTADRVAEATLRPYKGYSNIRLRRSDAEANYHGLQLFAARRKGALTGTLAYTWSKSLGNVSSDTDTLDPGEDPYEGLRNNYGPTSRDRRHIFAGSLSYRAPFFGKSKGAAGALLGGWQVTVKANIQSGDYITITGNTSIGERRADYLGGPIALPSSERNENRWFNTAAFATAPDDRRGTAGRGTVETPGLETWTVSLRKRFKLARDVRMTVQIDAFNAFNHVNFRDPENTVTSSSFGQITTAGAPRQLQLGIRLDY